MGCFRCKQSILPTGEVYTSLQTGMIDTINSPPEVLRHIMGEFLKYAQKPYHYADAYIMANQTGLIVYLQTYKNNNGC